MRSRATAAYGVSAPSKLIRERWALCPQVQPVASLSTYSQGVHTLTYTQCIYKCTHSHMDRQKALHSCNHKQHWWPHPALLSGWAERKALKAAYEYLQYGALQQRVCLVAATGSQSTQFLAPAHTRPLGPQPQSNSQYRDPHSQTDTHTCVHTHTPTHTGSL